MHVRFAAPFVILAALASAPSIAVAQQDTMPRWGVEASSTLSGSLLRFTGPARAWVFNASALWDRYEEAPAPFGAFGTDFVTVNTRVGMRFYRRIEEKTRPFWGLSALLSYQHSSSSNSLRPGGAVDIGASHFFSKNISLGFLTDLSVLYSRDRISAGSTTIHRNHLTVAFGGFRLLGGVYF
jgi:hypothetical protein